MSETGYCRRSGPRTRYGTRRTWLTVGEKLALRIERELNLALATTPTEIRKLGKWQRGHGVIAWNCRLEDGISEVQGEQSMGETLRAKVLTVICPKPSKWQVYEVVGD